MVNTSCHLLRRWSVRVIAAALVFSGLCAGNLALAQAKADSPLPKSAQTADKPQVSLHLEQFKVTRNDKGEEQFQSAESVKPGDVVEYRLSYRNNGQTVAKELAIKLPVPEGAAYVAKSASPQGVQVATADGKFDAEPLKRTVIAEDGKPKQVNVPYVEYRTLRWRVADLAAGKEATTKARVQIEGLKAADEQAKAGAHNATQSPIALK